jgi:hypothetical protein
MTARLIAVTGGIGAGKDTVAKHLSAQHGFQRISIAEPLKRIAQDVYGLEHRHVFGSQNDKAEELPDVQSANGKPRTPRQILEWLGTEGFRSIDPDTWVKLAMRRADAFLDDGVSVVITDTRFENEFEAVKQRGGEIWVIRKVGGRQETSNHASDVDRTRYFWKHTPDADLVAPAGDLAGLFAQADIALR